MKKAFIAVAATFLIALAGARNRSSGVLANSNHANDAAYQDGAYLGGLAAHRGEAPHISVGRWATANDRKSFAGGYIAAYDQTLGAAR
jgi:hypothetical protein